MAVDPQTGEMAMKLYDLTAEYDQLAAVLDEFYAGQVAGLDDPDDARANALEVALDALQGAVEVKAEAVAKVVIQRRGWAEMLERDAARQTARAKIARAGAERLKDYLRREMALLGDATQKFDTPAASITLAKQGEQVVEVTDVDVLPDTFKKARVTITMAMLREIVASGFAIDDRAVIEVDKAGLNAFVKEGGVCPQGATYVDSTRRLIIK